MCIFQSVENERLHMNDMSTECHCRNRSSFVRTDFFGLSGTILMAVLPKCPFCILAYTSTALLCAPNGTVSSSTVVNVSHESLYVVLACGLVTLAAIGFNYKGYKTLLALSVAAAGISISVASALYGGGEALYYSGTIVLFSGVWMNGSLTWFLNKLK